MRNGIDIPDPYDVIPTSSGCRAVVRSGTGTTYVVDGVAGAAFEIDLGGPAYAVDYTLWEQEDRWGLFREKSRQGTQGSYRRFALVDFATGAVTDLRDISSCRFSPDGGTLAVVTKPDKDGDSGVWLIPAKDPGQVRAIATGYGIEALQDFDGERLLYRERRGGEALLVLASVADGRRSVVARSWVGATWPEPSQFWPGRSEIAVLLPDRFAVIDPGDGTARERFTLDGSFVTMYLPPSGKRAILHPSKDSADRAHRVIDLEQGTSRRLEGESGEPAYVIDWGIDDRWLLVSLGNEELGSDAALAILDAETGTMSPMPAGNVWRYVSLDYRTMLFDLYSDEAPRRCTLLDLVRGTLSVLDEPCDCFYEKCFDSLSLCLSADGKFAAYSTGPADGEKKRNRAGGTETRMLTVVEMATRNKTLVGPGRRPVWLVP